MAGSMQRPLTAGEIALAQAAYGGKIDYGRVKLSDGPGSNPLAHMAFAKGNPAITVGSTVYFKQDFCPDFSAPGRNRKCFIHEMTHVWQHQHGINVWAQGAVERSYDYELVSCDANFTDYGIEEQASIVEDYSRLKWGGSAEFTDSPPPVEVYRSVIPFIKTKEGICAPKPRPK